MIKPVCSVIVWGRACFSALLILHTRSCLNWVMTASTLLRPSATVWVLRTVVPGGTSLERLSEWTGHWPWHRTPSNGKKNRWHKWWLTKPLCRVHLFLICPVPQQTACFFSLQMLLMCVFQVVRSVSRAAEHTNCTHALIQHNIYSTHTSLHTCQKTVISCISLLYVRHHRINIWF